MEMLELKDKRFLADFFFCHHLFAPEPVPAFIPAVLSVCGNALEPLFCFRYLERYALPAVMGARMELGQLLLEGRLKSIDAKQVLNWLEQTAEFAGEEEEAEVYLLLGRCSAQSPHLQPDLQKATRSFARAAENGSKKALKELRSLAKQGNDSLPLRNQQLEELAGQMTGEQIREAEQLGKQFFEDWREKGTRRTSR